MPRLKTKTYKIIDQKVLFDTYPNLFQVAPDHGKIKKALSAGFRLPGIELIHTLIETAIKESNHAQ